jgi:hypothetical protein
MFICRIEGEPKKYKREDLERVKYYNMLIKNHVLEYHYADKNKKIISRKIYNEELEYQFVECYKYDNYSYILGLERNSITKTDVIIVHVISDDPNFDIFDTNTLKTVREEIINILNIDIELTSNQINIL